MILPKRCVDARYIHRSARMDHPTLPDIYTEVRDGIRSAVGACKKHDITGANMAEWNGDRLVENPLGGGSC